MIRIHGMLRGFLHIIIAFFLLSQSAICNAAILPVPLVSQEKTHWCWDAGSQAILAYYGVSVSQCEIADFARIQNNWGYSDCCLYPDSYGCNNENSISGSRGSTCGVLSHWGLRNAWRDYPLSQSTVSSEISSRRPFGIAWRWNSGGGHFLVGRGIEGNKVHYLDPWPGNGFQSASYEWVAGSEDHTWIESIQLITPGPEWVPLNPLPQGTAISLRAVWGASGSNIFVVGDNGTILRYNGSVWGSMTSGTANDLNGVWGSAGNDVYAVGTNGTILHYNGSTWNTMTSNTPHYLKGVWGTTGADVFVVGDNGTILHYNGSSWSPMNSTTSLELSGIWGSAADDVYVAGDQGLIMRYNGSTWNIVTGGSSAGFLESIWGSSAGDIFAVGEAGTILHFNGSAWSSMPNPLTGSLTGLRGIWGSSGSFVFAVGDEGTILHYNGSSWASMTSGTDKVLWGVWGSPALDVFAAGDEGTVRRYSGPLVSDFTAEPRSGSLPLVVSFSDRSTGAITSWLWNFGDGTTSTSMNPTHTYTRAGTYTPSLTIAGPDGTNTNTKTAYISVLNTAISCSPVTLALTCLPGYNAPGQTVQVWNSGDGTINYTLSADQSWISFSSPGGSSAGASDRKSVTIHFTTSALAQGSYSATITISAPEAANAPVQIPVRLTVLSPTIAFIPGSLTNSCWQGYNAPTQTFQVWNSGGGTINYSLSTDQTWLTCQPSNGSSTSTGGGSGHSTIRVNYAASGLAPGSYPANITISAPGAMNTPRIIPVSLKVNAPLSPSSPVISQSIPASISVTCAKGANASSQSFDIWNSGGGSLDFTLYGDVPWLSLTPSHGTSTGGHNTIIVGFTNSSLPAGTYSATITVSAPLASNSPQVIPVNLKVSDQDDTWKADPFHRTRINRDHL